AKPTRQGPTDDVPLKDSSQRPHHPGGLVLPVFGRAPQHLCQMIAHHGKSPVAELHVGDLRQVLHIGEHLVEIGEMELSPSPDPPGVDRTFQSTPPCAVSRVPSGCRPAADGGRLEACPTWATL